MAPDDPILETWSFSADTTQALSIMPDGCRDLIIKQRPGRPQRFFVSPLMAASNEIFIDEGETFIGVRLKPGAAIDAHILGEGGRPDSMSSLVHMAREAASMSSGVSDMLQCLAVATSPTTAAHDLGVSLRTLQRHTIKTTGQTPDFWRRLARARRAARRILSGASLQETAYNCRFSDQAHMTRELKKWFAMTPGELTAGRNDRNHPAWDICLSGYDAPLTGEQISIR